MSSSLRPVALGLQAYISSKSLMPMLQPLHFAVAFSSFILASIEKVILEPMKFKGTFKVKHCFIKCVSNNMGGVGLLDL